MDKLAIIILSDPKNSTPEEALGRMFNALVLGNDLKKKGSDFKIFFQGTGTRWVELLEEKDHVGHALYQAVKDNIAGASMGCATVFKANVTSIPLLSECEIPGVGGVTSIAKYVEQGYTPVTF